MFIQRPNSPTEYKWQTTYEHNTLIHKTTEPSPQEFPLTILTIFFLIDWLINVLLGLYLNACCLSPKKKCAWSGFIRFCDKVLTSMICCVFILVLVLKMLKEGGGNPELFVAFSRKSRLYQLHHFFVIPLSRLFFFFFNTPSNQQKKKKKVYNKNVYYLWKDNEWPFPSIRNAT